MPRKLILDLPSDQLFGLPSNLFLSWVHVPQILENKLNGMPVF